MPNTIKIAFHIPSEKFIHIDKASNGLSCNCECLKCNERLEAVQGKVRTHYFRHHTNINCEGSQETALHELGKQILVDNCQITIPDHGTIKYSDPVAEKRLETKRPDVSATFDGKPIYFEIFVSHAVETDKEQFFINGKHRSIEIDLSDCLNFTFEEIQNRVIDATENKIVIYWHDIAELETDEHKDNSWVGQLIVIAIALLAIFGVGRMLKKQKTKLKY